MVSTFGFAKHVGFFLEDILNSLTEVCNTMLITLVLGFYPLVTSNPQMFPQILSFEVANVKQATIKHRGYTNQGIYMICRHKLKLHLNLFTAC